MHLYDNTEFALVVLGSANATCYPLYRNYNEPVAFISDAFSARKSTDTLGGLVLDSLRAKPGLECFTNIVQSVQGCVNNGTVTTLGALQSRLLEEAKVSDISVKS